MHRILSFAQHASWHAPLRNRGVLAVEGADARKLLQGLVTSNVAELDERPQHAGFLSVQGRLLHEAFLVSAPEGGVLIDAERAALPALSAQIRRYRLRSKASVRDASAELEVVAVVGQEVAEAASTPACEGGAWADPRLPYLGHRLLRARDASQPPDWLRPSAEVGAELHALQLALLGVPSGERQLWPNETFPLEANLDLLGSISFAKGCYLGQELTARTHFRGVVRKRLAPLVDARLLPRGRGGDMSSVPLLPAFAHLPEPEARLAGLVIGGIDVNAATPHAESGMADEGTTGGAVDAGTIPRADGDLQDASGAKLGSMRAYDAQLGVGLALCRLQALQDDRASSASGALTWEAGPALAPLRPSWWPKEL